MKNAGFTATEAQKRTVARLKVSLGEMGYFIFDVSTRFRRHPLDFLAMPKKKGSEVPDTLVRIRPTPRGRIIVQGFGARYSYAKLIKHEIKKLRKSPGVEVTVQWHNKHLPYLKAEKWGGWFKYFTEKQLAEVLLFTQKEKRRPFD